VEEKTEEVLRVLEGDGVGENVFANVFETLGLEVD
jgi:hypothetical protein